MDQTYSGVDGGGTQGGGAESGGNLGTIQGQPSGGQQQSYQGQQGQQQWGGNQGQSMQPWESDPRFRGKQAADVWKSYSELEKKLGGVPDMERAISEWQRFGSAWQPYLEKFGWDPNRLAQALEARAQAQAQQGQPAAQPQQSWADAMTPESQERWIDSRFGQFEQKAQAQLQQVSTALVDYFNRFGDLAMRAIEQKFAQLPEEIRPKLAINDLLQEAVNIATNKYDPLEWAARIRTAEPQEALEARIRADERARVQAEMKNSALTTFSGTSTGAPRTLRPRNNPMGQAQAGPNMNGQGVPRVPESESINRGRDRFASKWNEITQT